MLSVTDGFNTSDFMSSHVTDALFAKWSGLGAILFVIIHHKNNLAHGPQIVNQMLIQRLFCKGPSTPTISVLMPQLNR